MLHTQHHGKKKINSTSKPSTPSVYNFHLVDCCLVFAIHVYQCGCEGKGSKSTFPDMICINAESSDSELNYSTNL